MRCSVKRLLLVALTVLGVQICFLLMAKVVRHEHPDDDFLPEVTENGLETTEAIVPIPERKEEGSDWLALHFYCSIFMSTHSCVPQNTSKNSAARSQPSPLQITARYQPLITRSGQPLYRRHAPWSETSLLGPRKICTPSVLAQPASVATSATTSQDAGHLLSSIMGHSSAISSTLQTAAQRSPIAFPVIAETKTPGSCLRPCDVSYAAFLNHLGLRTAPFSEIKKVPVLNTSSLINEVWLVHTYIGVEFAAAAPIPRLA